MICYHHDDLDGMSAGYCVHKFKPSYIEDSPSSFIKCDYNTKFDRHTSNDDVFIVDISISEGTYPMLLETCKTAKSVVWIDHHATSKDVIHRHFKELQSIENLIYFVSTEASGAALTYSYFKISEKDINLIKERDPKQTYSIAASYKKGGIIEITIFANLYCNIFDIMLPTWLYFVDDYDCWKKQEERSNFFSLASTARSNNLVIEDENGNLVFNDFYDKAVANIDRIVEEGRIIMRYINSRYYDEYPDTFEWTYDGTTFLCKNATGNSWNFLSGINKYDATILFNYSGKSGKWEYSVYSSDKSEFNCKEFCEKFGGGGHPHASGFSSTTLIFTSPKYNK